MILRAKWFVDRNLLIHENGSVRVGKDPKILDLGNSILLPGLVNSHCHLDYTRMRGLVPAGKTFEGWIRRISDLKKTWSQEDFVCSVQEGLQESLEFGTTQIGNWICSTKTVTPLNAVPLRVLWFLELIVFKPSSLDSEWDQWMRLVEGKSPLWSSGLAPHAPYTCHSKVVQDAALWSRKKKLPWSMHVAESKDEEEMMLHSRGVLYDRLNRLGRDMTDCDQRTPLGTLKEVLMDLGGPLLRVHANHLHESDFQLLQSLPQGAHVSVVHCPRSHAFFGHTPFPFESLAKMNVCLGTDSLASNADLSMFAEMKEFSAKHPAVSAMDVLRMATVNGARALGLEKTWFEWQDWIAIPSDTGKKEDVLQNITYFTGRPRFVMVNGQSVID
jgi:cytosine/adenosine deaminase-related metal-dependent hydrolase